MSDTRSPTPCVLSDPDVPPEISITETGLLANQIIDTLDGDPSVEESQQDFDAMDAQLDRYLASWQSVNADVAKHRLAPSTVAAYKR